MIHKFNKSHSKLSSVAVAFDAGSRTEGKKYNPGISHMLEHCIFKGTSKRSWEDINREVAFLGGFINAFTSHERVQYYISAPVESIEKSMEILSDIVFNSTFPEEEFLKEKEVVKEEEVSTNDSIDSYMWSNFSKNFFSNYLSKPVIGTQESISKFTREEVAAFHSNFCKRESAVVALSSNIKKGDAKDLMVKYFGKPSGRISGRKKYEVSSYGSARTENITKPGIEHTYVYMGMPLYKNLGVKNPVSTVMDVIMSRGMDSRLFTEVREKKGLVYGISAGSISLSGGGSYIVDFSTRDKNVDDAISIVKEELLKMATTDVTSEELQRAKNKMRSSFYASSESSMSLMNWSIDQTFSGGPMMGDYIDGVEKVTAGDIRALAKDIFDMDKLFTVICRKE